MFYSDDNVHGNIGNHLILKIVFESKLLFNDPHYLQYLRWCNIAPTYLQGKQPVISVATHTEAYLKHSVDNIFPT